MAVAHDRKAHLHMTSKTSKEIVPADSFSDDDGGIFTGEVVEYGFTELTTVTSVEQSIIDGVAKLPDSLNGQIDLAQWYYSLARGDKYISADPNAIMRKLLLQTANAKTVDDLFERTKAMGLQGLIPNVPGKGSGPIDIIGLNVVESHLDGGVPCFMILEIMSRRTGERLITTTGAQEMQMQVLGCLTFGIWPIPCQIKRIDVKDKGGRYMFRLYPLD